VKASNLAVLPHVHDLPHQDLVLAADLVLGKPGYGTVAEAIVARRPFVITPRGDFREFPVLARGIEENLPSARLTLEELVGGEWTPALRRALSAPAPGLKVGLEGAAFAARRVREVLSG
jgi:L-arabinokinase